ncbi:transient receptor potential cation channel subfamily V member 6-like [Littorina saxatilis]|uniref:transient receptor potential cation channel subfamily V member 6-like n=1 Tax=Littorina saxatilis TaxID=31220 RepID=UPI0038B58B96
MGNKFGCGEKSLDPDSAWKLQNKEMAENPMYKFADLARGGRLVKAYVDHGPDRVKEIARTEMVHYLYNGGKGDTISKVDYVRWCAMMRAKAMGEKYVETSAEELLANFKEEKFNKFEPHEACWDLFKRGGVGETPFHMVYLMDTPVHFEVGKALLEVFPKLALDVYEGEEYFGESSLHIAVILDDLDAVQILVKNGAAIHQRATGRFFLPEDQKKKPPAKETDYSGYCYYGEYPLAFAACRGSIGIYDYLIDHGADPNAQDSFGNTILHMVVIHEQSEMFRHAVRHHVRQSRTDILNKQSLTPLTLASKLGRAHIFKDMLDLGSIEFWRFSNVTCSAYPLASIDSIGPTGDSNRYSALMIIVNGETDEHLDMLGGGVIRQLLDDKWKTFAKRRFIERLIIAFVHLILLSVAIYTRPTGDKLLSYNGYKDALRYFAEVVVCVSCLLTVVLEGIELAIQGLSSFLKNCSHAPDQAVYLLSCISVLACIPFRVLKMPNVEDILLIIAAPGSWFFLLFFARGARLTGPFVTMIYKMISGDLLRFSIIYCIFLVGFTQGFYFLFRDVTSDNSDVAKFSTLPDTILNLFQMTLGEFKYEAFNYSRYAPLTKIVFAIFMLLVPILLLNMLIAMMGNTYNQVIAKSEKEWRRQWAKIVVVLERGYSKKKLLQFQQDYSVKLAGPPKHQLGEFCNDTIEQRALVVIKSSNKTRAKTIKTAIINWKRIGKEVVRQRREWKRKGSKGQFNVNKRRGTVALEDMGMLNLSGAVNQLAWEKDMDFNKGGQQDGLSPRSPGPSQLSPSPMPQPTQLASVGQVINGGPGLPNGTAAVRAQHQQAVSSTPTRRARNLVYNRVAPLLPPLTQEDSNASGDTAKQDSNNASAVRGPSVMALDLKSISSFGGAKEHSIPEETPRLLLSPKKEPGMGGFKDCDSSQQSPRKERSSSLSFKDVETIEQSPRKEESGFKDVEAGQRSPRKEQSSSGGVKDVETGLAVETAHTQSELATATSSPPRLRRHKKKKSKSHKRSRESTPQHSPSPRPPANDFDSPDQGQGQ